MIEKTPLHPNRIRTISGSFAWIPHRFLRAGFFAALSREELLLYLFLVLVADRQGLSYYGYDKICTLLGISVDEYIMGRNGLIDRDLLAFDGRLFQVLSLPQRPMPLPNAALTSQADMAAWDPATIHRLIENSLRGGDR